MFKKFNMEKIFNYEWLNNVENFVTRPCMENDDHTKIYLKDLEYEVRFSTSVYSGYIVTIRDLDTDEKISFNCERTDIEPEWLEKTYLAMRNRFAIYSNGAHFPRKNIKIESVTVPKEKYEELCNARQRTN